MPAPFHLTVAKVKAAALKALDEGRLQIQDPLNNNNTSCQYRRDNYCCVIGASLDNGMARRFDNRGQSSIETLIGLLLVTCDDGPALIALQKLHDELVCADLDIDEKEMIMREKLKVLPE